MLSLKQLAIRGAVWSLMGYGASQLLRISSNLILTRLLFPDLFGLMSLTHTFITGLHLFSDIGVRPSIIQNPRGDDAAFINTAWTIQTIRGGFLWLGCLMLAGPVGHFYQEPQLYWLLPTVGLATILDGFSSTAFATLNRRLEISRLTRFEFTMQILSVTIMVVWASITRDISALVGSHLIVSFIRMVCSHRLDAMVQNRWQWDASAAAELVKFGRWIFVSTAMTFLASQADRLLLGKLFLPALFGVYAIALNWSDLPQQLSGTISGNVIFPVVSQQAHLPREVLAAKVRQKRRFILGGFIIGLSFLTVFGDLFIQLLYDQRYRPAAWMLPILVFGNWPRILPLTIDPCLFAIGKPVYMAVGNCLKFIYMVVVLPLAFKVYGPLGAIVAIAFNDLPFYYAVNYGLWRENLSVFRQDFIATLGFLTAITLLLSLRYLTGWGHPLQSLI